MFLDFDDPFHGKVWMPDSESNLGIVEVAYTDGEFPYFEKRFSC